MRYGLLINVSLLAFTLLSFFLVGEVVVRALGLFELQEQEREFYRPNPNLTIRKIEFIPGKEGTMFQADVRINSLGFRGREYTVEKPEGTVRILILGDSNTFGLGVSNEETYTVQLETLLNSQGRKNYEVWNLGMIGDNTLAELELLKVKGVNYDPDIVILGYHLNDPECPWLGCDPQLRASTFESYDQQPLSLPFYETQLRLTAKSQFLRWLLLSYEAALYALDIRTPHTESTPALYQEDALAWKSVQDSFEELHAISKAKGIPMVLLLFPEIDYLALTPYPFAQIHEQVRQEGKRNGFEVLDLADIFQGHSVEILKVRPDDAHPGAFAHRLIAGAIHTELKEQGLLG